LEKQYLTKEEMKIRHETYGKYNKTLLEMRMEAKMVLSLLKEGKLDEVMNAPAQSQGLARSGFATMVCRMARHAIGCWNFHTCVAKEAIVTMVNGAVQTVSCAKGILMPSAECVEEGDNYEPSREQISSGWDKVVEKYPELACQSEYNDEQVSPPISEMQTGEPNPQLKYMDEFVKTGPS
jgi:hypothetical protein